MFMLLTTVVGAGLLTAAPAAAHGGCVAYASTPDRATGTLGEAGPIYGGGTISCDELHSVIGLQICLEYSRDSGVLTGWAPLVCGNFSYANEWGFGTNVSAACQTGFWRTKVVASATGHPSQTLYSPPRQFVCL